MNQVVDLHELLAGHDGQRGGLRDGWLRLDLGDRRARARDTADRVSGSNELPFRQVYRDGLDRPVRRDLAQLVLLFLFLGEDLHARSHDMPVACRTSTAVVERKASEVGYGEPIRIVLLVVPDRHDRGALADSLIEALGGGQLVPDLQRLEQGNSLLPSSGDASSDGGAAQLDLEPCSHHQVGQDKVFGTGIEGFLDDRRRDQGGVVHQV